MEKYAPLYATQRYAGLLPQKAMENRNYPRKLIIFLEEEPKAEVFKKNCKKLEGGRYCCMRATGSFWEQTPAIIKLLKYIEQEKLVQTSDYIVEKAIVDYTISDKMEERLYEFQIKV